VGGHHCIGVNRAELLPAIAGGLPDGVIETGPSPDDVAALAARGASTSAALAASASGRKRR